MARGTRAPNLATQQRGTSDLLLIFGVAAFVTGLIFTVQGLAAHSHGTVLQARVAAGDSGGEMRRDIAATPFVPDLQPTPWVRPRPEVYLRDGGNDSLAFAEAIDVLKESQGWLAEDAICQVDPCTLSSAMRGDWIFQASLQQSLPREEPPSEEDLPTYGAGG